MLLVWGACAPPLLAARRAIGNRRRILGFAGLFLVPFAFILLVAGPLLEDYLLLGQHVLATPILGVPYLIVLVEALSLAVYYAFRPHLSGTAAGAWPFAAASNAPQPG